MTHRLELHTCRVERTHWWKDQNRIVEEKVWMFVRPDGSMRLATMDEIALWEQLFSAAD